MKRAWIIFLPAVVFVMAAVLRPDAQEQKLMKADVGLLVRVFDGDRAVAGLSREQFRVSEDGEAREIRDFAEGARSMRPGPEAAAGGKPRCFALLFTVFDNDAGLRAALDRFFADALRPQDRLFVLVNRSPLDFPEVGSGIDTRAALDRLLGEQAAAGRVMLDKFVQEFARTFDMRKFRQAMLDQMDESFNLSEWLKNYTEAWKEYRRRFLYPDLAALQMIASPLAGVKSEKWLIAFQQLEIHSHITMGRSEFRIIGNLISRIQDLQTRLESEATSLANSERNLRRLMARTEKELKTINDFPGDEMRRFLSQAQAPYHAIFLPAVKGRDSEASTIDMRGVTSAIEDAVRGIARAAGGSLHVTNDPARAVAELAPASDVFYRITYTSEAKKEGRVKVEVPGKRFSLAYDATPLEEIVLAGQQLQPANAPLTAASTIEITGFHFENKKFSLEVGNFARMKQGGKNIGRVTVRISIEDNNSGDRVFDQSQDMICEKEVLAMHIDFPKLGAGIYTLAVEARDLFTGQQASKDQTVQVE